MLLSWKAASDAVGVAGYRVYRGGRLLKSTRALKLAAAAPPRGKTHRFQVRAFDAARNLGPAASITVKTPRG